MNSIKKYSSDSVFQKTWNSFRSFKHVIKILLYDHRVIDYKKVIDYVELDYQKI